MKVIAVLNQKGGSGKTTIAVHLARALQLGGHSVVLVDSDSQGSARDWSAAKENQPVMVVGMDRPVLDRDIKRQFKDTDFVIIDGAPSAKEIAISAVKAANMVLIPVHPSQIDVWSAADITKLVRERIDITDGKLRAAFVISRAIRGTRLESQVGEALAAYQLAVLTTTIHQRVAFAESMGAGSTVLDELASGDAAAEVVALRNEVIEFLRKSV